MDAELLWEPSEERIRSSRMQAYLDWLRTERECNLDGYHELWEWSVDDLDGFWQSVWDYFEVRAHSTPTAVLGRREMPGAEWFPGATLNYAEHALSRRGDEPALIARSEARDEVVVTRDELAAQVGACAAGLRRLGVGVGDRVAAFMPNIPETIVAFLATASLGAVWSSCAPEFGVGSVVDRFEQISPTVLLAVDGYRYNGKDQNRLPVVAELQRRLPGLRATVLLPYLDASAAEHAGEHGVGETVPWSELLSEAAEPAFEPVPFDAPLWILYSSGTTGLPKGIVQGQGGILLEHLKMLGLHSDLGEGDRFLWFTTTGWMMWNYLVSGLLVGATLVLFDGSPGYPDMGELWRLCEETGVTFFGTSAPFITACMRKSLTPGADVDLSKVATVGSTGAPLPKDGFRWLYEQKKDWLVGSVSGGTDLCTAFVASSSMLPVYAGELQCRALGARVEAFDENGEPVLEEVGELVITEPMPSMPLRLWGDDDGSRYRESYFDTYPGVWRHGDWIEITERKTAIITGRSDSTLNRGGVRMGTADFYRVVEQVDGVEDSVVVEVADPDGSSSRLELFVVPSEGAAVDDALRNRIVEVVRSELSARHVPDGIHEVTAVPRTLNGKKLEVPVKRILEGRPLEGAVSKDALANPESLEPFVEIARHRGE